MKTSSLLLVLASAAGTGCSSAPVVLGSKEFVSHPGIDFERVRFRRPESPASPAENFDCADPESFFRGLDLGAIRNCFTAIALRGEAFEAQWNLAKEERPSLVLRDPEDAPACLRTSLGNLPIPRELVYVVPNEATGRGECYTSRLALGGGDVLGWELPRAKVRLQVRFPLKAMPASPAEAARTLQAWILTVFRGGSREGGNFRGRFLPTRYCAKCLGIPERSDGGPPRIALPTSIWPSPDPDESVR